MISDGGMERRQSWEGGTEGCMTAIDERRRDKMVEKKKKSRASIFSPPSYLRILYTCRAVLLRSSSLSMGDKKKYASPSRCVLTGDTLHR